MTVSQAVQFAYMAPNALKTLSSLSLRSLTNQTEYKLNQLKQKCPQSQKKDRAIYHYQYTIQIINRLIRENQFK